MAMERRMAPGRRVAFERALTATLMGIDGTWRRDCKVYDISDDGARLAVAGAMEGINVAEFFLLFQGSGLTYRRCQMRWCKGPEIGVRFIKAGAKKKRPGADAGVEEVKFPADAAKSAPGLNSLRSRLEIVEV